MFKVVLLFRQIRKLQNKQKHQLNLKAFRIFCLNNFIIQPKAHRNQAKKRHLPLFYSLYFQIYPPAYLCLPCKAL